MTRPPRTRRPRQAFDRRILLMVTGRTPRVVTETRYALAVRQDPPCVPTEVHPITTAGGAQAEALRVQPGALLPHPAGQPLFIEPLKRYFDAKDAAVTLADIPFVRLRNGLPSRCKTLEQGAARCSEVVIAVQRALELPAVSADYRAKGLHLADGRLVELGAAGLASYAWLARRAQRGAPAVKIPPEDRRRWGPAERSAH